MTAKTAAEDGFPVRRDELDWAAMDKKYAKVGHTNLRLQSDLYHVQIMEGDLAVHVRDYADITAYIQIAGVPERHESDTGEINYPYLFELIDEVGYDGWVGCEYRPRGRTEAGLDWFAPYAVEEQRAQGNL